MLHILQQISVIRSDFGHEACRPETEAFAHRGDIVSRVVKRGRGDRSEIRIVISEQIASADIIFGLHEPAAFAN